MRYAFIFILACEVIIMSHEASAQQTNPSAKNPVVGADNQFAMDLYRQLDQEQPGKNLFFSPTSISVALAMTAAGARGQTEAEMAKVLRLDENLPQGHAYYQKLLEQWNAADKKRPYQLRVANRLWGQKGFSILPAFLTLTRQQYGAEIALLNFADEPAARREINQWIQQQTNDKIKDLIGPRVLDALTRLVLTNAIYFKGEWMMPFDKKRTRDEDFTVSAGEKIKAPLMQQKASFNYMEDETLQALEMPYKGWELSMVVLLPKQAAGLPELEKAMSVEKLSGLLSKRRRREVITFLPKFKLEASFGLKPTLEALGMKLAFTGQADFSGISSSERLYISAVIHKAYVDVNEQGTEAAAATAVVMRAGAMRRPEPTPVFRADHPFLFLIRDTRTDAILFLGRVVDPR
jgi:serpin B